MIQKAIFTVLFFLYFGNLFSQNTFTAIIKDETDKEVLPFVNVLVEGTNNGGASDINGKVIIKNIPNGKQTLIFSYVGYRKKEKSFQFPLLSKEPVVIYLEKSETLQEITVSSMRTNNHIEEIPTRVEVLGNDEVVEETGINPGNISKLLSETSGVNVQHTSAVSGNVSFRIQGLPGKYTQLLKDGFPSYGGFASGLSLLQIPPLDLQQVEIIKGSASTLYGGDAIAGIINLISKRPNDKPKFSVLLNQTHLGGNDLSSFYSGKNGKYGFTLLTSFNTQKAKDVSGNNFTDIPEYNRAVVTPKFFFDFNKNNHLIVGLSSSYENRLGGDIYVIKNQTDSLHRFFENNETKYLSSDINFSHRFDTIHSLTVRANVNYYNRNLKTNTNNFSGNQITAFSEVSYLISTGEHNWVTGLDFYNDQFLQTSPSVSNSISYHNQTIGIFSQDNWHLTGKFSLEPGIRYDYSLQYGSFLLPRLAMMYKFSRQFSSRLSGGLGYKLPTPFTDESERTRYQSVFFNTGLKSENSAGINLDFTYKTQLSEELFLSFNQAFFAVTIQNPIIANPDSLEQQIVYYQNVNKNLVNKGMATNIRLSFDELVLYVDYTHLDARKQYDDNRPLEFTPQNRLTTTLAYEDEETGLKTGLEVFYTGNQYRENGTKTPGYWLLGTSVQKRFGHFTIALNVENILNIRQTRYEHIVSGNLNNPVFNEIYAPLDGIVGNVVLKFDLF